LFDWKNISKTGLYFFLKSGEKRKGSGKNLKKRNFFAKSGRGGNPASDHWFICEKSVSHHAKVKLNPFASVG